MESLSDESSDEDLVTEPQNTMQVENNISKSETDESM